MGTWGTGWFENDAAADFLGDLRDEASGQRGGLLLSRLRAITDNIGYLEGSTADKALAAVALIAVGGGANAGTVAPDVDLPERLPSPDASTFALARATVDRLAQPKDNEWLDLWEEAGSQAQALARLAGLQKQLAAVQAPGPTPPDPLPDDGGSRRRRWWRR